MSSQNALANTAQEFIQPNVTSSNIAVSVAKDTDYDAWEKYLERHAVKHHAYSWRWRQILSAVFHHQTFYLIAENESGNKANKQLSGILPLCLMKSRLFGSALISLPYLNAGGVLADSPAVAQALLLTAEQIATSENVNYLELRHTTLSNELEAQGFFHRSHCVSQRLSLPASPEELFASFSPRLRSQIRRPSKNRMFAEVVPGHQITDRLLNGFYQAFSEHARHLGMPAYPKKLFGRTLQTFGHLGKLVLVTHENKPVAAGVTLRQGELVEVPWAALSSARSSTLSNAANMMLFWEMLKVACEDGAREFDFGLSASGSGVSGSEIYRLTQPWGGVLVPLHWYYRVYRGELPEISRKNLRSIFLAACWKRLPLFVTNLIGPKITKWLP